MTMAEEELARFEDEMDAELDRAGIETNGVPFDLRLQALRRLPLRGQYVVTIRKWTGTEWQCADGRAEALPDAWHAAAENAKEFREDVETWELWRKP